MFKVALGHGGPAWAGLKTRLGGSPDPPGRVSGPAWAGPEPGFVGCVTEKAAASNNLITHVYRKSLAEVLLVFDELGLYFDFALSTKKIC